MYAQARHNLEQQREEEDEKYKKKEEGRTASAGAQDFKAFALLVDSGSCNVVGWIDPL